MKIEFLFFDGCPSWKRALDDLKDVMEEIGIDEEIEIIEIKNDGDVQKHRFLGSPSIRVDGRDIEEKMATDMDYNMRCRVYSDGQKLKGWPSKDMLRNALG